jgi:hypothetical protein
MGSVLITHSPGVRDQVVPPASPDPQFLIDGACKPLAEAWKSGGNTWTTARREEFPNNLQIAQLIAVSASGNRSKGGSYPVPLATA